MKNYYEILEVNEKASKEVIDKAYKVLIKKYHPDLYKGDKQKYAEKKTKEINEAYKILSDEFLREQYDNEFKVQGEKNNNYEVQQKKSQVKESSNIEKRKNENKPKVGSLDSIIQLVKDLIYLLKNKEKREEIKKDTKKDIIALLLTIVVVILLGVILWFIPFTNGWIRELLFDNVLFEWIASLFGG